MLDEIGFVWQLQEDWTTRYNDLIAFKQRHGHWFVPAQYKENKSLGFWVHNLRQGYKNGKLSDERVALLNEIGFIW